MIDIGPTPQNGVKFTNENGLTAGVWEKPDDGSGFGSAVVMGHEIAPGQWQVDATILQPGDDGAWNALRIADGGMGPLTVGQFNKINTISAQTYGNATPIPPVDNTTPYAAGVAGATLAQYCELYEENGVIKIRQKT